MRSSFYSFWKRTHNPVGDSLFILTVSFLSVWIALLLDDRTMAGIGAGPDSLWFFCGFALAAVCLVFPTSKVSANSAARPGNDAGKTSRLLAIFSLAALVLLPWASPFMQIGLCFLAVAGLISLVGNNKWPWLSRRFQTATATLFLICAAKFVFDHVDARLESFGLVASAFAGLLNLFGQSANALGSSVFMSIEGKSFEVLCSTDKFGGSFPWLLTIGLVGLAAMLKVPRNRLALWLLSLWLFVPIRAAIVVLMIAHSHLPLDWWWEETHILVSFLPLAVPFLLFSKVGFKELEDSTDDDVSVSQTISKKEHSFGRPVVGALAWSVAAFVFVCGWNWCDPGTPKDGKVLIDEHHSRWEWSEDPLDKNRYGVKTVYSYYCMAESLKNSYEVERNFAEINDEVLKDVSVLVLKTPTKPYSAETIDAIERYVHDGGGLWMIGDHTDIFGMNTYLNSVGSKFGLSLNPDSVIDPVANREITRVDNVPHPITFNMGQFLWYTGDSMNAPLGVKDVMLRNRLLRDGRNLAVNTYFGDFQPGLEERVGPVVQAAAISHGKGRVAVWTDSTLFSNFSINLPGKMELARGYIDWLSLKNTGWRLLRPALLIASLALVVVLIITRVPVNNLGWSWVGVCLGMLAVNSANNSLFRQTDPVPYDVAFLEPEFKRQHLPLVAGFGDPEAGQYLTSFVAVQRAGLVPRVCQTVEQATKASTIVWTRPDVVSYQDWKDLRQFVKAGGKLIVLDGGAGHPDMLSELSAFAGVRLSDVKSPAVKEESDRPEWADQLLSETNLSREGIKLVKMSGQTVGADHVRQVFASYSKQPVTAIASVGSDQQPVGCKFTVGKGQVFLTSTRSLFSDLNLGANSSVPTRKQLQLLNTLFDWFEE